LAGFQANFRQRALEWGNFRFPDMIDPFFGFVRPTEEVGPDRVQNNHVDLSIGFIGYSEAFYIGVAGHHLTQPDESFFVESKLPFKLTIHSGANIPITRRRLYGEYQSVLIPNIVIQNQGTFWSFFGGLSFNYSAITGGLGLRHGNTNPDALVILLGIAPQEMPWRLGYSYDYTVSRLTNALGGAHEISLMYQFACPKKTKKIEPLRCPKF
jgi:type IX secretion system PorP/SprF family membrane protein